MEQEAILASQSWVNAGGMILILIGVSLFIAELMIPSYGMFGFAGGAAAVIGVIQLHQTGYMEELPFSKGTLSTMVGLGILFAAFGAKQTYNLYKKKSTTGVEAMIGEKARVALWKGKKGRINVQGEDWQAYSDEKHALKRNDLVLISKVEGLKIKISHIESNE